MVVLDEADEMLNMGFIEDIETILAEMPEGTTDIVFFGNHAKTDSIVG